MKAVNNRKILMLGTALDTRGGVSTVVNQYLNSALKEKFEIKYIETHCDGGKIDKLIRAWRAFVSFIIYLIKFHPDIIHIHGASRASFYRKTVFILLSKLFRKKVVFHLHGGEFMVFYRNESNSFKKKYIKIILESIDKIIVLSNTWRLNLKTISTELNTIVLYNSVFIPEKIKFRPEEIPKIFFMGKVGKQKGIHDLIEAGRLLSDKKLIFKFYICGDGQVEYFERHCKKKGVSEYFIFKGWISGDEKRKMLEHADIFVLPSYNEGMPMSVIEAISYGIPVVATDVGGIPEIIEDGVNGFLIKPGDIKALAENIEKLLIHPCMAKQMRKTGYKIAQEKFNITKTVKKLEKIYLLC